jgi:hypothetical protein
MTIFVVGSSHARRIGVKLERIPRIEPVVNLGIPGAKFSNLKWPDKKDVKVGDKILVVPFGNDLQNHRARKEDGLWKIQKYSPISEERYSDLMEKLKVKLAEYPSSACDKFIVTNFYRFLGPKPQHNHFPGWFSSQKRYNRVFDSLETDSRTFVIRHQTIVSSFADREKALRNWLFYSQLQYDGIHFRDYDKIARNILDFIKIVC